MLAECSLLCVDMLEHVKKLDVLNILNHRSPITTVSPKQFSTNVNVMVFPFFPLLQYKMSNVQVIRWRGVTS